LNNKNYSDDVLKNKLAVISNQDETSKNMEYINTILENNPNKSRSNSRSDEYSDSIHHLDENNSNETIKYNKSKSNIINRDEAYENVSGVFTKDQTYFNETSQKLDNKDKNDLKENINKQFTTTLDSCTSSEFKAALNGIEQSFISYGNNDINNLNIHIK
jgi:hypothetical protein